MEPIISYRLTDAGIRSYHFYAGRQFIGKTLSALDMIFKDDFAFEE